MNIHGSLNLLHFPSIANLTLYPVFVPTGRKGNLGWLDDRTAVESSLLMYAT